MSLMRIAIVLGVAIALSGCVSGRAKDTTAYRQAVLHSPIYSMGYNDGCSVANYNWQRQQSARDRETFEKDSDYREGWLAATTNCKDVVCMVNTGKPNDHLNGLF